MFDPFKFPGAPSLAAIKIPKQQSYSTQTHDKPYEHYECRTLLLAQRLRHRHQSCRNHHTVCLGPSGQRLFKRYRKIIMRSCKITRIIKSHAKTDESCPMPIARTHIAQSGLGKVGNSLVGCSKHTLTASECSQNHRIIPIAFRDFLWKIHETGKKHCIIALCEIHHRKIKPRIIWIRWKCGLQLLGIFKTRLYIIVAHCRPFKHLCHCIVEISANLIK